MPTASRINWFYSAARRAELGRNTLIVFLFVQGLLYSEPCVLKQSAIQIFLLHKLVPNSSYTEKVFWVARVFFEIAAEGEYKIIDGAGAGCYIVTPCGL